MEFRTLTPDKTNALNSMRKDCVPNYEPKTYYDIELEAHVGFCLIYKEGTLVGYIAFDKMLHGFEVKELFVKQSHRKQNVATETLVHFSKTFGKGMSKLDFVKKVLDKITKM